MKRPITSIGYSRYVLFALACASFLNSLDRTLWSVLAVPVRQELMLSDTQLGLLGGFAFALFYAVMGLPIARLSDTRRRVTVISLAVALWSAATAACGLAHSYLTMFMARVGVGVGEAGCVPTSHSLLSDYFPQRRRAFALGLFEAGGGIGLMTGIILSGWLAERIGWRSTFIALGVPGLLVALMIWLTVREPVRGGLDGTSTLQHPWRDAVRALLGRSTYRRVVIGFALCVFGYYGSLQWLPSFLSRSHHLSITEIGLALGLTFGTGAIVGTAAGALLAPHLIGRDRRWELRLPALAFAGSAPLFLLVYQAPSSSAAIGASFLAAVAVSFGFAPALASIQSLAEPQARATAVAIVMFVAAVVGQGGGPAVVGVLSDGLGAMLGQESLRAALSVTSLALVAAGINMWSASRSLSRELLD